MSIQNNLEALKQTLARIPNKSQPITVAQATILSNLLLELYGAIQAIPEPTTPTLDEVLSSGASSDLGMTIASITLGDGGALSSVTSVEEAPITPNRIVELIIDGSVHKISSELVR